VDRPPVRLTRIAYIPIAFPAASSTPFEPDQKGPMPTAIAGRIVPMSKALGGLESEPLRGIQTVTVPPGGAAITEFKLDVPGNYTLVDHALARAERGLAGILHVEGAQNPDIYNGQVMPGMGH